MAAFGHPKAFRLSEDGFSWIGDYEITADGVLGGIAPKANKMGQAKQMLRELALTSNAVQSNEIINVGRAGNFKEYTGKCKKGAWHSGEEDKQFLVLGIG